MPKAKAPGKRPVGRPKVHLFDENQISSMAAIGHTHESIALTLGCNRATLERNYAAALRRGADAMRNTIRVTQYEVGVIGRDPGMLKFLGMVYCQQRTQNAVTGADGGPVEIRKLVTVDL